MPKEIKSLEEFLEVSKRASECRVKETKEGKVKLKLRTPRYLYTFIVQKESVEDIIKKLNVPVKKI